MAKKKFMLNAPKKITFWVAIALGVIGVVGQIVPVGIVQTLAPWILALGWLLLALGCFVKGL